MLLIGVADDFFRFRIPVDLESGADGDVAEMANRGGAVTDGDVSDGEIAVFFSLQPFAVVVITGVKVHVAV